MDALADGTGGSVQTTDNESSEIIEAILEVTSFPSDDECWNTNTCTMKRADSELWSSRKPREKCLKLSSTCLVTECLARSSAGILSLSLARIERTKISGGQKLGTDGL